MLRHIASALALLAVTTYGTAAEAHPTPFSYVDLRVATSAIHIEVTAHIVDIAHELMIARPETLLEQPLPPQARNLGTVLLERLALQVDNKPLACDEARDIQVLSATQSIRWSYTCAPVASQSGTVETLGPLFPYDPEHHTFINVYVDDALRAQGDLTRAVQTTLQLRVWSITGTIRRFTLAGIQHILSGPDHLLFLIALLLRGGPIRRLVTIVTAFTASHSLTLAAAVLNIVSPPASVIEPAIALSIIAVGLDNFRRSGARDRRALAAGAFGLIHGFGFASVLHEMHLTRGDLAWSLVSFNTGVELGQVVVVICVAWLFSRIRHATPTSARQLVVWGSSAVVVAGTFWFVERVAGAL